MSRMEWDNLFMEIVRLYSKRSVCKHFKVGAVFVRNKRILSAGYNGSPKGEVHCIEVGCAKEDENGKRLPYGSGRCRGAHAEMNAIANASSEHVSLESATVYCTFSPCYDCSKILANLGIKKYVFDTHYPDEDQEAMKLFRRQGIEIVYLGK
ncbi:MAG: dCMP deaminase family protein [bacterium]